MESLGMTGNSKGKDECGKERGQAEEHIGF